MQLGQVAFRKRVLGVDRVEPDQLHDFVAGRQVLAGVDDADAEFARERRAYRLLANHRLLCGDLRFGAVEMGLGFVQFRSRAQVVGDDLCHAVARDFCKAPVGLQCVQLRPVHLDVEFDEELPLIDVLSRIEIDLANDPRHFGRYDHAAQRRDGADRLERRLPALARDGPGGHDGRRRPGIRRCLLLHLQVFPSEHAAEYEREEYEYDCQSLDQGCFADLMGALELLIAGLTDRPL